MRIQHKLTGLLLGVSILPIVAMALLAQISLHRLSKRIGADIRESSIRQTSEQLRVHLHNFRNSVASETAGLLLAVKLQATEVEKCLALGPNDEAREAQALGFALGPAAAAAHRAQDAPASQTLDFDSQDVFLLNAATAEQTQRDQACLKTMTVVYRYLRQVSFDKTLWHYTSLANGLHTVYPAGGRLPVGYDPQKRRWYTAALDSPQSWASAFEYDAASNIFVLTMSAAVHRPDGSAAGVTAIDLPVNHIFENLALSSALSGKVVVFLAGLGMPGEETGGELRKYMQAQPRRQQAAWNVEPEMPTVVSADEDAYDLMMEDLRQGRAGIRTLEYQGRLSLWAYSERIGQKASLHMIVPYSDVLELAAAAQDDIFGVHRSQIAAAGYVLLAIIGLTAAMGIVYARRFTRPIHQLAEATQQLGLGQYDAQVNLRTGDELEMLAATLNDVGPKLQAHEKAQRHLALAGAIQKNLLPTRPPALKHFDVAGLCLYCDETGGDYFDFIASEDRAGTGIVLGDVTGHGITAALVMASARSLLRNSSRFLGRDLTAIMRLFNDQLEEDTDDDKFMTLFYGYLSDADRSLTWASGGHDPAIWYHSRTGTFEELPNTGPLMGMMKGMAFEQAGPVCFEPGDVLVIGTDGIWEAQGPNQEAYGKDRLMRHIARNAGRNAAEMAESIVDAVKEFITPQKPGDDITVVVVKSLN